MVSRELLDLAIPVQLGAPEPMRDRSIGRTPALTRVMFVRIKLSQPDRPLKMNLLDSRRVQA